MPSPVTIYYTDRVVRSVYPSEVQSHLDNGGSLNPLNQVVSSPESKSEDLHSLTWKQLKDLSDKLGLIKPDDVSWKDFIPEIEKATK